MRQPLALLRGRTRILNIISNAGWLGVERIVRAATSFIVVVWIARTLGPELFGALNFAQSIVIGLLPLVTMGLNPVLVKDLVQQPERRDALLSSAFLLRLGGALILLFAAQTLCLFLTGNDPQIMSLVLLMALGVFAYLADGLDSDYQARMQNKIVVQIKLAGFAVGTALKIALIFMSAGVQWFAIVMSIENLLIASMLWFSARHFGCAFNWSLSVSMVRELLALAGPMFLAALLANLFSRMDQVLLGAIAGYETLGAYAVACKIVEALAMFPQFAAAAIAPILSGLQRESHSVFESRFVLATRILFWISVAVCAVLVFVFPKLVPWAFGIQYGGAVHSLEVLIWGIPLMVLGNMTFQWALHMGGLRFIIGQGVFMLLAGVLLCWLMIDAWGQVGAAAAIVLTQLLAHFVYPVFAPAGRRIMSVQYRAILGLGHG